MRIIFLNEMVKKKYKTLGRLEDLLRNKLHVRVEHKVGGKYSYFEVLFRRADGVLIYEKNVDKNRVDKLFLYAPTELENFYIGYVFRASESRVFVHKIFSIIQNMINNSGFTASVFDIRRAAANLAPFWSDNTTFNISDSYLIISAGSEIWYIDIHWDGQKELEKEPKKKIKIEPKEIKNNRNGYDRDADLKDLINRLDAAKGNQSNHNDFDY